MKLYGGPAHGMLIEAEQKRIEVAITRFPELCFEPDFNVPYCPHQNTTYYVRMYREHQTTRKGSLVARSINVGVWEEGELTTREQWDIERDLRKVPWTWCEKPSILHDFDAWWEMELYQTLGINPVR